MVGLLLRPVASWGARQRNRRGHGLTDNGSGGVWLEHDARRRMAARWAKAVSDSKREGRRGRRADLGLRRSWAGCSGPRKRREMLGHAKKCGA